MVIADTVDYTRREEPNGVVAVPSEGNNKARERALLGPTYKVERHKSPAIAHASIRWVSVFFHKARSV